MGLPAQPLKRPFNRPRPRLTAETTGSRSPISVWYRVKVIGSASENDRHDVSYVYVSGRAKGTAKVTGPKEEGSWDVRLHDSTAGDGNEIASVTFTVS